MRRTRSKKIGVIGTRATINSRAYVKAIKRLDPAVEVFSAACPLFVPIVEEGLEDDEIARMVVDRYLEGLKGSGIDVLVMGCTHYPILERRIRGLLGAGVYIVNTGRETARDVQRLLEKHGAAKHTGKGGCSFYVTDAPDKLIGSRQPCPRRAPQEGQARQDLRAGSSHFLCMIARVALPLPIDKTFSYALPNGLAPFVRPFSRVKVPFQPVAGRFRAGHARG